MDTKYTVETYYQKLHETGYDIHQTFSDLKGITGDTVDLASEEWKTKYKGFTWHHTDPASSKLEILANGSAVGKIYYNRNIDTLYNIHAYYETVDSAFARTSASPVIPIPTEANPTADGKFVHTEATDEFTSVGITGDTVNASTNAI